MDELTLNFYSIRVRISAENKILELLSKDFSYFITKENFSKFDIELKIFLDNPPFEKIPPVKVSFYHPEFVAYDYKDFRYVDYKQKALSIYNKKTETAEIYSQDINLLHEISYLFINSRVGELLDKKGYHRVHSLGFNYKNKGVLILLPSGGGKTTLALELLKNDDIKLLSDDIPLVKNNILYPFPLRIGIDEQTNLDIPKEFLSNFVRRKFGTKVLIDLNYFKEKISPPVKISAIFIAERENSNNPKIVKTSKIKVFTNLIKNCVIGYGLPQIVEYFLSTKISEIIKKRKILFSRFLTSIKLTFYSKTFKIILSKNIKLNTYILTKFIKNTCK